MSETYTAPNVPDAELTPSFVRDELLRCFESANQQFFKILGQPVTDEQLRAQVREFVTGVFQECGVQLRRPRNRASAPQSISARRTRKA